MEMFPSLLIMINALQRLLLFELGPKMNGYSRCVAFIQRVILIGVYWMWICDLKEVISLNSLCEYIEYHKWPSIADIEVIFSNTRMVNGNVGSIQSSWGSLVVKRVQWDQFYYLNWMQFTLEILKFTNELQYYWTLGCKTGKKYHILSLF